MTDQHSITPPPELAQQWLDRWSQLPIPRQHFNEWLSAQAARWGADQELEACCEYLTHCAAWEPEDVKEFCDLRRPKPPSLKEQALEGLRTIECNIPQSQRAFEDSCKHIRRALESLPD